MYKHAQPPPAFVTNRAPSILIAPDAFKGSLSAGAVAQAIAEGIREIAPAARLEQVPLADGGEGTIEAFASASPAALGPPRRCTESVTGPLGETLEAEWLHFPEARVGLVEMAQASGLGLVPLDRRDPLVTTTRGTGELVLAAMAAGVERLFVSLGGSATVDGGTGMARALGYRFLDQEGREVAEGGGALAEIDRIDLTHLAPQGRPLLTGLGPEIIGLVDVDNPLTGPEGAAAVYGPQKGADERSVARLDRGLVQLARVAARDLAARDLAARDPAARDPAARDLGQAEAERGIAGRARTVGRLPVDAEAVGRLNGAGAAGGLGAGLCWFVGAELRPGADAVLDAMRFEERLSTADCVFTGEGRVDGQTARGKVVAAVARRASDSEIPVWVLAGTKGEGWEAVIDRCGVVRVETIAQPGDMADEAAAMHDAAARLKRLAATLYAELRSGS